MILIATIYRAYTIVSNLNNKFSNDTKSSFSSSGKNRANSLFQDIIKDIDFRIRYKDFEKQGFENLKNKIEVLHNSCLRELKSKDNHLKQVVHDLKGCLASVIPSIELISDKNNSISRSEYEECIKCLKVSADNALKLLEEILPKGNKGNLDSNNSKIELKEVNIRNILQQIKLINSYYLEKYNIVFDYSIELESDYITSNRSHLIRILSNLISNAIKFCDKENGKGQVIVSIFKTQDEQIYFDTEPKEYINISVFNNGNDIDVSKIEDLLNNPKIYTNDSYLESINHLYKSSNGYNSDFVNHGIGLQIVKKLVRELDGRIEARSKFGGCEVTVEVFNIKLKNNKKKLDY